MPNRASAPGTSAPRKKSAAATPPAAPTPASKRAAVIHLKRSDPVLAGVIERVGAYRFTPRVEGTHFDHVARAIIYQQLSGKAAATIHGRVQALYGGTNPTPARLLATDDAVLRSAGLSRQKTDYLKDLAARAVSGELPIDRLHQLDDEAVTAALCAVKGVGRWTAQMFLLFRLGRPDVLPDGDLGIQTAVQRAFGLAERPRPADVLRIGERWRPHASCAAWYLWRWLDNGVWD